MSVLPPVRARGRLLVRTGTVVSSPCKRSADRRSRRLRLTQGGEALLARAVPAWEATHAAIEDLLPGANPEQLRRDLRVLSCLE